MVKGVEIMQFSFKRKTILQSTSKHFSTFPNSFYLPAVIKAKRMNWEGGKKVNWRLEENKEPSSVESSTSISILNKFPGSGNAGPVIFDAI